MAEYCGAFTWKIRWDLKNAEGTSGYIVQNYHEPDNWKPAANSGCLPATET
jgi:hypothetical protein